MTDQEKDRIQNAIRHIQTAVDVDSWAMEIAVDAMAKQIPKKPTVPVDTWLCPSCGEPVEYQQKLGDNVLYHGQHDFCPKCGQAISWGGRVMTLEEAIKHCEEIEELKYDEAKEAHLQEQDRYADECSVCAAEHRQLAEWLKELKAVHDEIDDADDEDEIFIGYLREKMRGE